MGPRLVRRGNVRYRRKGPLMVRLLQWGRAS